MKRINLLFFAFFLSFISLAQQDINVIVRNNSLSSGSNFDLGFVMIDHVSTNVIIVENNGDATLTLSTNALITGTDAADFSVEGSLIGTIAAGENRSFSLTFDPSISGSKSATISISSDDPDESTFTFTLSGTALDKPADCLVPTLDMESFYNGSMLQLNFGTGQAEGTSDFEAPSGWTPLASQIFAIFGNEIYVAETLDPRSGTSAMLLSSTNDGNGDVVTVMPCEDYPAKFSGYYKLSNAGFGSATIVASTGGGIEENRTENNTTTLEISDAASSYSLFELDLKYDANSVDSLFLYISASSGSATFLTIDDLFITEGTPIGVPFAPNAVTLANQTISSVTVNWLEANDHGAEITGYTLEQKTGVSGTYSEVYAGSNLTYDATGLTEGETYFFRVKATNAEGDSDFSTEVSFVPSSDIIMSSTSILTCDASFFDTGGPSSSYTDDEDLTLTIIPENPGDVISISFNSFELESGFDFLRVYDGPDTSSPLLFNLTGSSLPSDIMATGSGGELTFNFSSDGSGTAAGWEATISCSTPPPTIVMFNGVTSTCDALFVDSGGSDDDYLDDEDFVLTIEPETLGGFVSASFTSFALESGFDFLRVYDGPSTSSPLLFNLTGSSLPSDITATETGGELTFHFTSDGSNTQSGWLATISCEVNSTIWNGASWDNGDPDDQTYAIIDGTYTGAGFTSSNLDVNTSNTVIITSGTLDVKGDVNNNGTINIESGSSLLTYNGSSWNGNNATVQRNTRYSDGKYSFVGTPMQQDESITGSDLGSFIYSYDETIPFGSDGINRWTSEESEELIPGKGYTQANQLTIVFEGVPNTGTIIHSGDYTEDTNDANEGWNLVANPYASAISISSFLLANTNTSGTIYLWDDNGSDSQRGNNSDYITVNGTMATNTTPAGGQSRYNTYLGSAQGFFVQLSSVVNTDITFTEEMRDSGNNADANFFRKNKLPIVRLNLTDNYELFKQTVIGFAEDAKENDLNATYDGKAFNASSDFGIFTMKSGRSLALNGMNHDWKYIQLQLNIAEAGDYSISVEFEDYDQLLYLRDNFSNEVIDLREEAFSFSSQVGIFTDRFELISKPSEVLGLSQESVFMYVFEKILHIEQKGNLDHEYQLFNMNGKRLLSTSVKSKAQIDLNFLDAGVYLVFDGDKTHKILLK